MQHAAAIRTACCAAQRRQIAIELGYTRTAATVRLNRLVSTFAALWCPQRDDDGDTALRSEPPPNLKVLAVVFVHSL